MEPIAKALCQLNNKRKGSERHLIVVTFDCLNHGSRLVHKLANFAWSEGKHQNPNHAVDMWTMVNSTARVVSELIDVLEHYLFGPKEENIVEVWGVLGFSMGGHATFMAAANGKLLTLKLIKGGNAIVPDFLIFRSPHHRGYSNCWHIRLFNITTITS